MRMTSSVAVKCDIERAWTFLVNEIEISLRYRWAILFLILHLVKSDALAADLDSLRRALEEGHDLTRGKRP